MSRIDEAMRRSSLGSHPGRGGARSNEGGLRLAEDFTLNEYPLEDLTPRPVDIVPAKPVGILTEPRVLPQPHLHTASVSAAAPHSKVASALELDPKLILGSRDMVSTEQYRKLAATLHDAQIEKGLKVLMVTSAAPREGKTLTVVNLALTLSESYGRRVLLIDADLRRPSIHQVLKVPNDKGLRDVLASSHLELPLAQISERLSVLPSGRVEENPLAGLASERMRTFLDHVAERFDWVLLDTPPVGLLPDAHVLGRLAQASVFVIRAGVTPFAVVQKAISDLGRECIIGTVLNDVEPSNLPATGYYGHYYGMQ